MKKPRFSIALSLMMLLFVMGGSLIFTAGCGSSEKDGTTVPVTTVPVTTEETDTA